MKTFSSKPQKQNQEFVNGHKMASLIFITVLCFPLPVEKESGSRLENHGGTEHNSKLPSKLQSHRTCHLRTDIRFSQTAEGHEASFLYLKQQKSVHLQCTICSYTQYNTIFVLYLEFVGGEQILDHHTGCGITELP